MADSLLDMPTRSLSRVKARDRDGWLALFEDDAVVQDPVGKSAFDPVGHGQIGKEKIAQFYDNVISKTENFDFKIHKAIACGDEVAAYVTMYLGDNGLDAINIYKQSPNGKIALLRSFWQQPE